MTKITELKYSNTNTYLIQGENGTLLFDTGWAGTFPAFCKAIGEIGASIQSIDFILISHFHPDHMGIAQNIADLGPQIVVADVQSSYLHVSDGIFSKEKNNSFIPIKDKQVKTVSIEDSREFLKMIGINGELLHTPGHSDDSISLWLDEGMLFVGDLNPLYELELHKGTATEQSWHRLLEMKPVRIYYGHAKTKEMSVPIPEKPKDLNDLYVLVNQIMRFIDRGLTLEKITVKTGADESFVEKVARMYLTHQNIGVQGILDRIM